jgi:hypothetical protein
MRHVAIVVTRRPDWVDHALASARRIAGVVVFRFHEAGPFADVLNDALAEARTWAPVCLKVDDHDTYPDDHAQILERWQPGTVLYGRADFQTCDGRVIDRRPTLCASALPTDLVLTADRHGAVTSSALAQRRPVTVETGVTKRICSTDWSWGVRSPVYRCGHGV